MIGVCPASSRYTPTPRSTLSVLESSRKAFISPKIGSCGRVFSCSNMGFLLGFGQLDQRSLSGLECFHQQCALLGDALGCLFTHRAVAANFGRQLCQLKGKTVVGCVQLLGKTAQ